MAVALYMISAEQSRRIRLQGRRSGQGSREAGPIRSSIAATGAATANAAQGEAVRAPQRAVPGLSERDTAILKQALDEWGADGLAAALDSLKGRLAAVAEMEMIWADPHSQLAQEQSEMLERALWVFEPEYVVSDGRFEIDGYNVAA